MLLRALLLATEVVSAGSKEESKTLISFVDSGEAISAPPPKPMIAMPVARPVGPGTT